MRLLAAALLFAALGCVAHGQEATTPQTDSSSPSQQTPAPEKATTTVPAGTRIPLALDRPIWTKTAKAGDAIYLETTAPVAFENQTIIPPGTYVNGTIDKIVRHGGFKPSVEIQMHFTGMIYANGYAVSIPGALDSPAGTEGIGLQTPRHGTAAAVAAVATPATGALIGAAASGVRGAVMGGAIGVAAGGVLALVLLTRSHDVFMGTGAPVDMLLERPLTLDSDRVADAVSQYQPARLTPVQTLRLARHRWSTGTCFTPGSPGTPDTYLPGSPSTPDFPGTPGTVIPGTPPTPATPYPCP
jgi:hypothetical protein